MAKPSEEGMEALHILKSMDPPQWLTPSPSLSVTTRAASQHLFSWLKPYVPKSPFDQLLVDGFDAEQIWQQIDIQSQPLLSNLGRQVKHWEKNPREIQMLPKEEKLKIPEEKGKIHLDDEDNEDDMDMDDDDDDDDDEEEEEEEEKEEKGKEKVLAEKKRKQLDGDDEDNMDINEFDEKEEGESEGLESEEEEGESEGIESEEEEGEKREGQSIIEDEFLKIKDLETFLEQGEAMEFGLDTKKNKRDEKKKRNLHVEDDEDEEGEEDDKDEDEGDEDEDDELGLYDDVDDEDEDENDGLKNARYEDFFCPKEKMVLKRKFKSVDGSRKDTSSDDEHNEKKGGLSTHEKQLKKIQSEIEKMEKANLEPKEWIMQGEVTAARRPKNSALEVDLDFEHNMRPAPVITEEVTASLEDMIKNRIVEGRFDDVQKASSLPSKAPRELKELDENKSKKGLAEVYEEEYVQKTNPAVAPLSFTDERKKEASLLFKKLCLKLDALSHFHFAPKPVIEDMSIQVNVPALAMEEIAPVAVSDAAMLAPEEVFSGKGDIKEEAELSQAERKRRRANKKRKFKAEATKRIAKKALDNTLVNHDEGKEEQ